jgi:hypothetical protein
MVFEEEMKDLERKNKAQNKWQSTANLLIVDFGKNRSNSIKHNMSKDASDIQ